MIQTHNTLVYLRAPDAEALRLQHLRGVSMKIAGDVAALRCKLVSADGAYLRVNVSYTKDGRSATILLMIPHQFVLLVVHARKENVIGYMA